MDWQFTAISSLTLLPLGDETLSLGADHSPVTSELKAHVKKAHATHSGLDTTFLLAHSWKTAKCPEAELSHTASGSPGSRAAAPFSPPIGGALCEASPAPELRLSRSAAEDPGLRATEPACSPMLRALPRALRLSRPWRSLGARGSASNATTRTPEIQVQALTGPDQGKVTGRKTKAGEQEDWITGRPGVEKELPDFVRGELCIRLPRLSGGLGGGVKRTGELGAELCSRGSARVLAGQDFSLPGPWR